MKLLRELAALREGAAKDEMMGIIDQAIKAAHLKGLDYLDACEAIAHEFRRLDKHKMSSGMDDEALVDLIKGQYDEDEHLDQNQAVTEVAGVSVIKATDNKHPDIFKNCHDVRYKGKVIGMVWQTEDGDWAAEDSKTGSSWDMIDSREDAVQMILDERGIMEDGENQGGETMDPASATAAAPQAQGQTPQQQPAKPTAPEPRMLSQAGGFSVEVDDNEQVSIMKGNQTVVTMPFVIWKQLSR
jgi:hypothetical protein